MPEDQPQNPESPKPAPLPRKRRRWPKVLAILVILLFLVVALIPTLASTAPARAFVLGKVNEQINGKVEIQGWSLGWFSPTEVTGIRVYDQDQRLILDVPRARLGLSLLDAARGDFALGDDNLIEIASFLVTVDENQQTSIDRLTKKSDRPEPGDGGPIQLPDVSGRITVNIHQGTIESEQRAWPAVHVRESQATATIADINQPIQSTLKLVYQIGQGQPSTIQTSGSVAAVKGNVLDLTQLSADQKVGFDNVNLAAAGPFVPDVPNLSGVVNGAIDVKAQGLAGLSTSGELKVTNLQAGPYQTPEVTIPMQITRSASGGDSLIKFENVGIQTREGTVALTGQVPESALQNVIDGKAPGAAGTLSLTASVTDLGRLASQFKETLNLQEGVTVTGGAGREELNVTFTPNQVQITQNLRFEATGTKGGQPIQIKPITVAASAVAIPSGRAMPDLRNLRVNVASTFATITGGGDSLAKLAITGKVALDALSTELSQFVDMQGKQLQGTGEFAVNTDGDLTSDSAPVLVKSNGTFQNVKIIGMLDQPVDQDRLAFAASGMVQRRDNQPVEIQKGYVEVVGGDPSAPLLELQGNYTMDLVKNSVPWFELTKCTVQDLPRLQRQYGGLVAVLAEQGITIDSGALYATAAGSYVDDRLTFSKPAGISITTLTLRKGNQALLTREVIRAGVNGNISLKNGVSGEFTDLSITTQSNLLTLTKGGQGPLTFTLVEPSGLPTIRGSGEVTLAADLKRVNELAQAFGGMVTVAQVQGGALTGRLALAKADRPQTDLSFNGQITGLTITNAAGPIAQNEQLTINLTAAAPDDLKANPITASAKVAGSFINANVTDARLATGGAGLDMLRSANVDVQVTDLAKAYALYSAAAPSAPTTGPAQPPLQVTGGNANVRMTLARESSSQTTNLNVSEARITGLGLKRGTQQYTLPAEKPINLQLTAAVKGASEAEALNVTQLSGSLGVASLSMSQPIVVTGLSADTPKVEGEISTGGKLEEVTPLLAALQGQPKMPYAGDFKLTQKFTESQPNVTSVVGSANVSNFRVEGSNFSEPQLAINNTIHIDRARKVLNVEAMTLNMPQSQALSLAFVGGINHWEDRRVIREPTKLDITYDLAKVWTIVLPMLSAEQQATYKDLKVAGKYQKSFTLTGAFPKSDEGIHQSFASLNAEGSLAIDLLDTMGLNVQKLQPQIKMTRGKMLITGAPAALNEGTLDASDIVIDMTQPAPTLTVARNKRLIRDAKVNPVLANSLGKFASPLFVDARQATGLFDLTVIECQQVPIGALMTQGTEARARVVYSIRDVQVDGFLPSLMAQFLKLGTPGLVGRVPESTVVLADGSVASDLTFEIARAGTDARGQQVLNAVPLKFNGSVGIKDLALRNFQVVIPKSLLPNDLLGDARPFIPAEIRVPITGTLNKIDPPDLGKAVMANLNPLQGEDPLKNLGNILEQLGGQRNQQDPPRQRGRGQ